MYIGNALSKVPTGLERYHSSQDVSLGHCRLRVPKDKLCCAKSANSSYSK